MDAVFQLGLTCLLLLWKPAPSPVEIEGIQTPEILDLVRMNTHMPFERTLKDGKIRRIVTYRYFKGNKFNK